MILTHYNLDATNALLCLRRERRIGWRAFGLGMVIASFANRNAIEAWPSRATLESISGIESRDIPRVTCELRDAGFMTIEERDGLSNVYHLTYGEIAACGDLAAVGKQLKTCGDLAEKPVGKQPHRTMKEQLSNNEGSQHDKKSPDSEPKAAPQKPKVAMTEAGFVIPDAIRQAWASAYPCIDIDREAAKAFAWCRSNPRKAPKKDYDRFLNSWLSRAAPSRPAAGSQQPQRSKTGELGGLAQMRAAIAEGERMMHAPKPVSEWRDGHGMRLGWRVAPVPGGVAGRPARRAPR